MSKPKPIDPDKRAAKAARRKRRKAAEAAGYQMLPRRARPTAQMDHGSNPHGIKRAREGERAMHRQRNERRGSMSTCISAAGEFSSHDLDDEYVCRDCHTLDEDALRAELRRLREQRTATLDETRERRVPLAGQMLAYTDFTSTEYDGNDHEGTADIERANLITSIVEANGLSRLGGTFARHKVVIDVDMPVMVIESSTPGHYHLIIDHEMDWAAYVALLDALVRAGLVERGYRAAAENRGHTAVRLPWVRKPKPIPAPAPLPAVPGCTCLGLDHRADCPEWVLPV